MSTAHASSVSLSSFITQLHASTRSDWLIFYEKEMDGSQRWFRLTSQSVKFQFFSVKNVLLYYKSNGQCLACVHPIRDALGQLGEHLGSQRCSRQRLEHLLRYLRALPTIHVHPELDGRKLDIVHSLNRNTTFNQSGCIFSQDCFLIHVLLNTDYLHKTDRQTDTERLYKIVNSVNYQFVLCDCPGEGSSEKNCCKSPATVLFRITLTRMITQYKLLMLVGSNHLLYLNYVYIPLFAGLVCAARFTEDKVWYRALVTGKKTEKC